MVLKTRVTGRDTWRGGLALLIVLGISCMFAGRVQAAASGQWQVFDPFGMRLSSVTTSPAALQGVIRVSADIRNVASRAAVGQATTGRGARLVANDAANLRKPPIRIPYKPRFRSPFAPPGFMLNGADMGVDFWAQ